MKLNKIIAGALVLTVIVGPVVANEIVGESTSQEDLIQAAESLTLSKHSLDRASFAFTDGNTKVVAAEVVIAEEHIDNAQRLYRRLIKEFTWKTRPDGPLNYVGFVADVDAGRISIEDFYQDPRLKETRYASRDGSSEGMGGPFQEAPERDLREISKRVQPPLDNKLQRNFIVVGDCMSLSKWTKQKLKATPDFGKMNHPVEVLTALNSSASRYRQFVSELPENTPIYRHRQGKRETGCLRPPDETLMASIIRWEYRHMEDVRVAAGIRLSQIDTAILETQGTTILYSNDFE